MKNTIFTSFLFFILLTFVTSCSKPEDLPRPDNSNNTVNPVGPTVVETLLDKDWVLVSGNFYYGDPKIYFNHPNTTLLNPFYGADCIFDSLSNNTTTWRFTTNSFLLNGVPQDPYNYNINSNNVVRVGIFKNGGGTVVTRIIEIMSITSDRLEVRVGELGTIVGNPYTILVFRKSGTTITNTTPSVPFNYQPQGVLSVSSQMSDLVNTKWVITRYNNGLSGNVYPNDTLEFLPNNTYKVNGGVSKGYMLSNIIGNNMKSLSLYSFSTLGGDYSGEVVGSFINDWEINNSQFHDMFNVNNTVTVWMTRIQ